MYKTSHITTGKKFGSVLCLLFDFGGEYCWDYASAWFQVRRFKTQPEIKKAKINQMEGPFKTGLDWISGNANDGGRNSNLLTISQAGGTR